MVLIRHYASRASGVDLREGFGVDHAEVQKTRGRLPAGLPSLGCVYVDMRLFSVGLLISFGPEFHSRRVQ